MINLNTFCRLCLSKEDVRHSLFQDNTEKDNVLPLFKRIMSFASVKIHQGDGLPDLLCQSCMDRVDNILLFKKLCEHVDVSLRRLLKSSGVKDKIECEEQVYSIVREVNSISSVLKPSKGNKQKCGNSITNSKAQSKSKRREIRYKCTEPNVKVEAVFLGEDNDDDWPESPPTSACSPSLLSPLPSGNSKLESVTLSNGTGKKRKKRDKKKIEHTCEFCGRKFLRANLLAQHELTHTAQKPFECSDCKKSFWYKASLIGHIKQVHTGDVNYSCELCGKGFFKKTELTRHKPTHSNETPHKCPQCGMGFKITKTLKRHIRNVHSAQRSHTCDTCGKSFTQLQTLKVHLVLHSGVKPYTCSYCGKGFSQSAPLKTHIRTHTGEKPYSCHACNESFATRSALTSHAFKHNGTLPYPCTRCSSTFRLKRDLTLHEQGHDDEESRMEKLNSSTVESSSLVNNDQPVEKNVHQNKVMQHEQSNDKTSKNEGQILQKSQNLSEHTSAQSISGSHKKECSNTLMIQQHHSPISSKENETSLQDDFNTIHRELAGQVRGGSDIKMHRPFEDLKLGQLPTHNLGLIASKK